jgi:FkbM family methyltransferase
MDNNIETLVFKIIDNPRFNNCDSKSNGESDLLNRIKSHIKIIFDVGCNKESEMLNFEGECHYFDPVKDFVDRLSKKPNKNLLSYFNSFGLGEEEKDLWYYPKYESFFDTTISCDISDEKNKIILKIKKAEDYILKHNILKIDFLKIDTEGFELSVLKGFGKYLKRVKLVQFEYGGTYLDNQIKLEDVKNYLESFGFKDFSYLVKNGTIPITDFKDHYQYCNIVCINKNI